jgi:acyl-CoA dehydrogenase
MIGALDIPFCVLPPECERFRREVRAFLGERLAGLAPVDRARNWMAFDSGFSRALGERGWIGLTWPRRYGGAERSALERYVLMEELLAAGAPVAAHWIAERQSALLLMRLCPDTLAPQIVPGIARGETYFAIGMSEPDTGSDLASVRTRARPVPGGWRVSGRKLWTSNAHQCHWMIALVRTSGEVSDRHKGLSQLLIDLSSAGLSIRPVINAAGDHDFNEVTLDEVFVPASHLLGSEGEGWQQVGAELSFERSGPERFLSSTQLVLEMIASAEPEDARHRVTIGRIAARYAGLRQLSLGVSRLLAEGQDPALAAALVKDQGALLEQSIPELAHALFDGPGPAGSSLAQVQQFTALASPSYSLRGGTREILRGIIARGLGLR